MSNRTPGEQHASLCKKCSWQACACPCTGVHAAAHHPRPPPADMPHGYEGAAALLQNLPRHPSAPAVLIPLKHSAPERSAGALYIATHDRTEPPADQVVTTEKMNVLRRQFHQREEARKRSSPVDDDREPPRKASRLSGAWATGASSDGEVLPLPGPGPS